MKIAIYSSGGDNPFWTIVKSEMTQKEVKSELSLSSMMMSAAREAKFEVKDEDPLQTKIDFNTSSISVTDEEKKKEEEIKKKIRDDADKKKEEMRKIDPYFGLEKKNKDFLRLLYYNFHDTEIEVYEKKYSDLLKEHNIKRGAFNVIIRNLVENKHTSIVKELKESRNTLISFKLSGPYF